MNTKNRKIW